MTDEKPERTIAFEDIIAVAPQLMRDTGEEEIARERDRSISWWSGFFCGAFIPIALAVGFLIGWRYS